MADHCLLAIPQESQIQDVWNGLLPLAMTEQEGLGLPSHHEQLKNQTKYMSHLFSGSERWAARVVATRDRDNWGEAWLI